MSELALIPSAGTRIMVGEREFAKIPPMELIPAVRQQSADTLVEQAEALEIVGNEVAQANGAKLLKSLGAFIKAEKETCKLENAQFENAIAVRETARDLLLKPVMAEMERIRRLLEKFGEQQELKRQEEARKQFEENQRIRREAAELERQKQELAAKVAREAREKEEAIAREKLEAEAKARREREAAEAEQLRLKRDREEAERRGTAEQMEIARRAENAAKEKAEAEDRARAEVQRQADAKAAEEKRVADAAALKAQQELTLRQAELNTAAAEVSNAPTAPKPAGLSGGFKWKVRAADETSEATIQVCMVRAFAVKPEWFTLTLGVRKAEAAAKEADGKLEVDGLVFERVYQTRST
jgi:hypothetical protein